MMKWEETVASQCRYGDVAERIFSEAEIIWEHSESDYQGWANVLAKMPDGTFIHYEWTYGSCSGCDEWEDRGLTDDEVEQEMRRTMVLFQNAETLPRYLRLEDEFKDASYPTANSPANGSIPGMMRWLGGIGSDFKAMGEAFQQWLGATHENP